MARFLTLLAEGLRQRAFWGLLLIQAVALLVPYALQRALLARMDPERRGRAWNPLSWAVALWWTNGLSMIPFAWITRPASQRALPRSLLALGWGLALTLVVVVAQSLLSALIEQAFGLSVG